jgi:hypothetical protein
VGASTLSRLRKDSRAFCGLSHHLTHALFSLLLQWGTWKSGVSLVHTGIRHPKSIMKNVIPVVMAGGMSNKDLSIILCIRFSLLTLF